MSASRIDDLLKRQASAVARIEDANVRRVLRAYEDARRQLREQLEVAVQRNTPATAQHTRVMLAQVEAGIRQMESRLGTALTEAQERVAKRSTRDLVAVVKRAEPEFRDTGVAIDVRVLERLSGKGALALHRHSVRRYGSEVIEAIQRELAAGVATGATTRQLVDRITKAGGSTMARMRPRAELIARMELSRVYNDAHLEGIHEMASLVPERGGDPLLKRIDEFIERRRNHPFSIAAHGTTALPGESFRVPVAAVKAAAAELGKSAGGVLWARVGGEYVGTNLPAHFNERGRITAWRASWATP